MESGPSQHRTWFTWIHIVLVIPLIQFWEARVLLPWEELVTSSIRHGFQEAARTVNGVSSWLLSIFDTRHRQSLKEAWHDNPWQKWWTQVEERPNTLNALLAALTQQNQQQQEHKRNAATTDGEAVTSTKSATGDHPAAGSSTSHARQNSAPSTSTWGFNPARRSASATAASPSPSSSSWYPWASTSQQRPAQQHPPSSQSSSVPRPNTSTSGSRQSQRTGQRPKQAQGRGARPVMFLQHSGQGVLDAASSRLSRTTGLLEDVRLAVEVHTARFFAAARSAVRSFFGLPPVSGPAVSVRSKSVGAGHRSLLDQELWRPGPGYDGMLEDAVRIGEGKTAGREVGGGGVGSWSAGTGRQPSMMVSRSHSAHISLAFSSPQSPGLSAAVSTGGAPPGVSAPSLPTTTRSGATLRKTASFSALEEVVTGRRDVSVADVIRLAGYPLEVHTCTTPDGYILCMERIPRHGSRDVVLFLHGLLDTSMSWVSAGVTGSQAFAAWDMGFDVWLANSRCNAPRLHQDPMRAATSPAYWRFSVNEMGELDLGSQLRRVHEIKCVELQQQQGQALLPIPSILNTINGARRPGPTSTSLTARATTTTSNTTQQPTRPASASAAQPSTTRTMPVSAAPSTTTSTTIQPLSAQEMHTKLHRPAHLLHSQSPHTHATRNTSMSSTSPSHTCPRPVSWAERARSVLSRPFFPPWTNTITHNTQNDSSPPPPPASSAYAPAGACSAQHNPGTTTATSSAGHHTPDSRAMSPNPCEYLNHPRYGTCTSTSGSDAEFFDAVGGEGEEAGMSGGGWDRGQGGGWPFLTRAAASDGDLLSVAAAVMNQPDAVKRVPSPTINYNQPTVIVPDPTHRPASSSFSPEAPSTPNPSSPHRSPVPPDHSDTDASRPPLTSDPDHHPLSRPPTRKHPQDASTRHTQSHHIPNPPPHTSNHSAAWSGIHALTSTTTAAVPAGAFAAAAAVRTSTTTHTHTEVQGSFRRATSASQLDTLAAAVLPLPPLNFIPNQTTTTTTTTAGQSWSPSRSATLPNRPSSHNHSTAGLHGDQQNPKQSTTPNHQSGVLVNGNEPYRLRVVAHSLGGMSTLIYLHRMAVLGRPSHIHRLVLLTPAGFHSALPNLAVPISHLFPLLLWLFRMATYPWWRNLPKWRPALPLYIPTTTLRQLIFKLMADLRQLPSMAELLRLGIKLLFSDDASQWDRALQMPHYSAKAMPAVSMDAVLHMTQCARSNHFRLFDYGSATANRAVYGQPVPPDVAEEYWRLGDLPVDLVAGAYDGIIPPSNVRRHYQAMLAAGCRVTYKEFEFGHLDFTFAVKDELKMYLLRALRK